MHTANVNTNPFWICAEHHLFDNTMKPTRCALPIDVYLIVWKRISLLFLGALAFSANAQAPDPTIPSWRNPDIPFHPWTYNAQIHKATWYPESVHWSPLGTDLLVTACPKVKKEDVNCTLFRYQLKEERWESLPELSDPANTIYGDAVYSPDANHIVAVETGNNCVECPNGVGSRLVLLSANGARVRYLTPHGFRIKPTFSKDGTRLIYWSLGLSTTGRTPIGLFDVWELDIETGVERQLTHFLASEIKAPPRYWPSGENILLVASEYARKPNKDDFRSKDPRYLVTYVSAFGRNGTVVTGLDGKVVRPYFWPSEDNWLFVLDISPDGQRVVYDDHYKCIKEKLINAPLVEGRCLVKKPNRMRVASYSPSGNALASVWGGSPALYRLGIVDIKDETIRFIDLLW
jgi:hypothetical protein